MQRGDGARRSGGGKVRVLYLGILREGLRHLVQRVGNMQWSGKVLSVWNV